MLKKKKKKNLPVNAGDTGDMGSISGSGQFSGEGNGNPLQYSCMENSMDRGAWWAIVPGVAESDTIEHSQKTQVITHGKQSHCYLAVIIY